MASMSLFGGGWGYKPFGSLVAASSNAIASLAAPAWSSWVRIFDPCPETRWFSIRILVPTGGPNLFHSLQVGRALPGGAIGTVVNYLPAATGIVGANASFVFYVTAANYMINVIEGPLSIAPNTMSLWIRLQNPDGPVIQLLTVNCFS